MVSGEDSLINVLLRNFLSKNQKVENFQALVRVSENFDQPPWFKEQY